MKSILFILVIIAGLCNLQSCNSKPEKIKEYEDEMDKIRITGIAGNAKGGAVVISSDQAVYYLNEIPFWDSQVLNKKVEVTGILKSEKGESNGLIDEKGEWKAGFEGEILILVKPEWKVLE